MWVWEAGLPPNTKPSATTHYLLRLVGMGLRSSLSVSGRTPAGRGGGRGPGRTPAGRGGGRGPGHLREGRPQGA